MTFCTGVKFSKSSDFDEIGLKLIRLTCAFRKCTDSYTYNVRNYQGVKGHSLCGVCGCWPLTPPLTYIRTLYIWQTIPFLNQHSSPINLSPFSMRSDHFENLTPVRKVVDLFPFIPLSWQRNIVWISCNWLFYSLWREEEFEICFNLIGASLSFIPILPLVKMLFEKMPGMFVW